MTHRFAIRVYYEDTDMGGIVYHANFLKFIERARSEWVAGLGLDQNAMRDDGIVFAVRRVEADYMLPARYGDELEVRTTTASISGARLVMDQKVVRGGTGHRGLHHDGRASRAPACRDSEDRELNLGGRVCRSRPAVAPALSCRPATAL